MHDDDMPAEEVGRLRRWATATRPIMTCDLCKEEIEFGAPIVRLSATRWGGHETGFDKAEFCGERCALAAVRALLNGKA